MKHLHLYHYALHILIYDVAWFACILLASTNLALLGPLFILLCILGLYLWQKHVVKQTQGLLLFMLLFWFAGFLGDTLLTGLNVIQFPETAYRYLPWSSPFSPLFMQALWLIFGMSCYATMHLLFHRYLFCALMALIGIPWAYWAGALLKAASLTSIPLSLVIIGSVYALLIPLTLYCYNRLKEAL